MKVSTLYGKPVKSVAGKRGYVISVEAERGKICALLCADDNEREFRIDFNNVLKSGDEIIFKGADCARRGAPLKLGRAAYDEQGTFLGILEDFVIAGDRLKTAKIDGKNYCAEDIVCGDAAIVKSPRKLRGDVKKNGKVLLKKGTPLTKDTLDKALDAGEYVQTTLKTI